MKKLIIILIFLYGQLPVINAQSSYWQQQVNYNIDVTLNDADHSLDGYVRMDYFNNSPDTLRFIWIHLWPNAYKNDRTAFSDQLLENGRTDFYFSSADLRGYINRLNFKVDKVVAQIHDHPEHQDIIQLILPHPLAPKNHIIIESPFHEKLPFNFSRGGHVKQSYQVTQWYPKPAVYDQKGWHPIPYLDQGEFFSEFGNYEVQISLPSKYIVAATGELQPAKKPGPLAIEPGILPRNTTYLFKQENVHDFAWFADKDFIVKQDSLKLRSGKIIYVFSYNLPDSKDKWKNSIEYIKQSIRTRSNWLGEYPYKTVSVVEAKMGFNGGMEYPTITSISPVNSARELEGTIEHEVGHNWNYGILGSNEREHPWMDEGINTFYDNRYYNTGSNIAATEKSRHSFWDRRMPASIADLGLRTLIMLRKAQPIETTSAKFTELNYNLVAYTKAAEWMKLLEDKLGKKMLDSCMQEYYRRWQFAHPYPRDLKKVFEETSKKNLDAEFALLYRRGELKFNPKKKNIKLATFFSFKDTDKHHYIFIAPAIGYNFYDKLMPGILLHNYTLPAEKFQFLAAPLYATGSKQLNGLARLSYTFYPGKYGQKAELSVAGSTFTGASFTDSTGTRNYMRFSKIVPSIKFVFANKYPRSHVTKFLQWKTFFINEQSLLFSRDTINQKDIISYPSANRYVNQLRFVIENDRVLYPYSAELQAEQGEGFVRLALTGNYFFNYPKKGGLELRVFAGKFFYLGDNTYLKQYQTDAYHLNMSGPKGYEDYTYSNYFFGRSEFEKLSSQQIAKRDGFFKVRTDLLSSKIGRTDDWLAAVNVTTTIPKDINPLEVLPIKIPLKLFLDIGTYAEAWKKNASTGRFIYDAGLQVSLIRNIVNIYIPVLYSKVFDDYFKSTITEKRFVKNISFSIDISNLRLKKIFPPFPF